MTISDFSGASFTAQRLVSLLPLPLGAAPAENMVQKGWEWERDEQRRFFQKYFRNLKVDYVPLSCSISNITIWRFPKMGVPLVIIHF